MLRCWHTTPHASPLPTGEGAGFEGPHRGSGGAEGWIFTRLPLMLCLVVGIICGSYYLVKRKALTERCANNLKRIYMALEMYEINRGTLPHLAFYPDDPLHDNDSLQVVLSKYGVSEKICVCPSAPSSHRELAVTYVWNVGLNGKSLHEPGRREWMLVELNALSAQVPAPHAGRYNVLFTDGKVEASKEPPAGLQGS